MCAKTCMYECCDGYKASNYYDMINHIIALEQAEDSIFDVYPDLARAQAHERHEWARRHSVAGME